VGDTVGDPFKDTSGPALNIVMKLMAIISVVRPVPTRVRGYNYMCMVRHLFVVLSCSHLHARKMRSDGGFRVKGLETGPRHKSFM